MFEAGKKVMCIEGTVSKGKIFMAESVQECTCGKIMLEIAGFELENNQKGCICECAKIYLGVRYIDSKFFRPIDETFAESVLAKAKMEAVKESFFLFVQLYAPKS